ncbi:MAG: 50S ribosomal protein L13 [Dissulfurispiraceae bacterium]|jgi:large subunit ribosomal protein L13|nr:50S ribosomal protein L13 [Dissulfurispiraceae bacterium]
MKTKFAKEEDINRKWYVVDADGQILGRIASRIASYLRGKHKAVFTPNVDTGDFVVIINAEKVKVTGAKLDDKFYHHHTGYIGNLKSASLRDRMHKDIEDLYKDVIGGMLPKNRLGRQMIKKLKVYRGAEHPHKAQNPELIETLR